MQCEYGSGKIFPEKFAGNSGKASGYLDRIGFLGGLLAPGSAFHGRNHGIGKLAG